MGDWFIGEIRTVAFEYAPENWMLCNGQLLSIGQYQALFALLGTRYGGDGHNTFALPNLNGRVIVGQGTTTSIDGSSVHYDMGQSFGQDKHTITALDLPWSNTPVTAAAGTDVSVSHLVGKTPAPSNNFPPALVLNYIIAVQGLWPPRP